MGTGEKPGFMGSRWMTIILIAVLVILAVVLFLILRKPEGFEIFRREKKREKPTLKPVMNYQLHSPSEHVRLELIDDGLKLVTEVEPS